MSRQGIRTEETARLDQLITQLGVIFEACGVEVTIEAHVDRERTIDWIILGYLFDAVGEAYEFLAEQAEEVRHESAAPTATPDRSA